MNRRQMTALLALGIAHEAAHAAPALPEVTAPSTPEAALRQAVHRWRLAERTLADAKRALDAATDALRAEPVADASERQLARLIEGRVTVRGEWRAAQREAAAAEEEMEMRARFVRGG